MTRNTSTRTSPTTVFRAAALAVALCSLGSAQAQTMISTTGPFPIVISQPGHYRLSGNLNVPAATHGIRIEGSNITLDLNGYTVRGPAFCGTYCPQAGQANGVTISAANVKVRNGSIVGFDQAGVQFANQLAVQLEDLTMTDNLQAGVVRINPPSDLHNDASPAMLRRVTVMRSGTAGVSGYAMTIESSMLMQNFGNGINSYGYSTIVDSVIANNKQAAYAALSVNNSKIWLADAMRGTRVIGNGYGAFPAYRPTSMGGNATESGAF